MTEKYFVDTNVLIYAHDGVYPAHMEQAQHWMTRLWADQRAVISTQVLKEFYQVLTRKLVPAISRELARDELRDLMTWPVIETGARLFEAAWRIEDQGHCSWWDALIIAAAQHGGCTAILSEDLGSHLMPAGITLINPFASVLHEAPADYQTRGF